ncbi:MAG: YitT family protein [Eubacteriales bacterium]|nr:YitT family protein [Eubacteriales bacterium]
MTEKIRQQNFSEKFAHLFMILFGNTVYALAVVMFILPNSLVTGGTTGLALAAGHFFGTPVSLFVLVFNLIMFLIGLFFLGKAFALTTVISSFYYPLILEILQNIPWLSSMTDDLMLSTVCAGILVGFAIGIVIKAGASTGGMDIPPLVLNKKFNLPVSVLLYGFDCVILLLQMSFSDHERILYGILLVMIYTYVLDKVLTYGTAQTQVKIVSPAYREINDAIIASLDRGSTLVHLTTGYLGEDGCMVLTVISNRQLPALKQIVSDIDPTAFMTIGRIYETRGRGFSLSKNYLKQQQQQ